MADNQQLYNNLRKKYHRFHFESFEVDHEKYQTVIRFHFSVEDQYHFYPVLIFPASRFYTKLSEEQWNLLAFHAGMAELVSYWKSACPPTVVIKPYRLTQEQIGWWKKLYFHGLGEFFYQNGIETNETDFMTIDCESSIELPSPRSIPDSNKVIVPVGGGKDSAVTLELLKESGFDVYPMAINPRPAILETIENAGISRDKFIQVTRQLDPLLLKLNEEGFLNGHTPFSSVVAFITAVAAMLSGIRHVALSNESSANEATIPGTKINHQYSKSFEFEKDFREYSQQWITPDLNYFSFLRPLSEMQIGRLFSELKNHYFSFKSCNRGSKDNIWCGECSKCLFTAIILGPHMSREQQKKIFGKDILDDGGLKPVFDQLAGVAPEKPFECVGTIDEVQASVHLIMERWENPLPMLIESAGIPAIEDQHIKKMEKALEPNHFLSKEFYDILIKKLNSVYGS